MGLVLVAGATGHVGRHIVPMLKEAGYRVRVLARRESAGPSDEYVRADLLRPATLEGVCNEVDAVVCCAGASMNFGNWGDRVSFMHVDFEGCRNLLDQALFSGVEKFVYVSLYGGPKLMHVEYARAHEYMLLALENSSIRYTVVRPTGFFTTMLEFLKMAQRGRGVVVGDGTSRTNPIHEADVARLCLEALTDKVTELPAGGPDTFTRREIVELAFEVLGREPKIVQMPRWVLSASATAMRPLNRRLAGLTAFGAAASTMDLVAPVRSWERLRDYFEQQTAAGTLAG